MAEQINDDTWEWDARSHFFPEGPHAQVERGVVFGQAGDLDLKCDIYRPPADTPGFTALPQGKRIGVLVCFGSGFRDGGSRDDTTVGLFAETLARAGYVCVGCDYRLAPVHHWPAFLHDAKACVRWMRANADRLGIIQEEIVACGYSAGGQLALLLGGIDGELYPELEGNDNPGHSSAVQACVSYMGPGGNCPPRNDEERKIWLEDEWAAMSPSATNRDFRDNNPLSYVRADFPPVCLCYGHGDDQKLMLSGIEMVQKLHRAGAHAEMHIYAAGNHGMMFDKRLTDPMMSHGCLFLDRIYRKEQFEHPIEPSERSASSSYY